jgi:hypothetical protein
MSSTIIDRSSGLGTGATPNGENATISVKVPVRVATTANITLAGEQTIDGVAVVADDRVLVKDQTDQTENGIYLAATGDWSRTTDCADAGDLVTGTEVRVNSGSTNQGRWYCSSADPIAIGTDNITWAQVTGINIGDGSKGDVTVSSSGTVWTIVQATLALLRGLTAAANKIPYFSASDAAGLLDFKDEDDFASDSATALASQQSIKAYIAAQLAAFSGGSSIIRNWLPTDASFPAGGYATLDTRNTHPVLDFNASAFESVYFHGVMPDNYETDADVVVEVYYCMTSATTGAVNVAIRLENMQGLDIDSDGFASYGGFTQTVPGTAGQVTSQVATLTLAGSQLDSLTAGDLFRLHVARNGADGSDTATGDMEVLAVEMRIS